MLKNLNTTHKPINTQMKNGGTQVLFKFDNGFGASVICTPFSYGGEYGLWELAVLEFDSRGGYDICYTTPITDDVLGGLDDESVDAILTEIAALPVSA